MTVGSKDRKAEANLAVLNCQRPIRAKRGVTDGRGAVSRADDAEKDVIRRLAAAGVRLRFDRVAKRLLNDVKAGVSQTLPLDRSLAFTVTAPIWLPAKTIVAMQQWLERLEPDASSTLINGNEIHARMIRNSTPDMPRALGFVYNPASNPEHILDVVEACLQGK